MGIALGTANLPALTLFCGENPPGRRLLSPVPMLRGTGPVSFTEEM